MYFSGFWISVSELGLSYASVHSTLSSSVYTRPSLVLLIYSILLHSPSKFLTFTMGNYPNTLECGYNISSCSDTFLQKYVLLLFMPVLFNVNASCLIPVVNFSLHPRFTPPNLLLLSATQYGSLCFHHILLSIPAALVTHIASRSQTPERCQSHPWVCSLV